MNAARPPEGVKAPLGGSDSNAVGERGGAVNAARPPVGAKAPWGLGAAAPAVPAHSGTARRDGVSGVGTSGDPNAASQDSVPCYALHGWCFGPDVWQDMGAPWPGLQALALPGYGNPDRAVHSPLRTLEALAQAVAQRLPPQPVDLLGWSLGALVALQLAASAPQRVRRLVLLGASARFVAAPDWPYAVAPDLLEGFRADLAQDAAALRARFALLCAQGESPAQARVVVRRLRTVSSAPQPVLDDGLAVLAHSDLRPVLGHVQAPVLLLHGARDALMPLAAAQALAQTLPAAHLQVLPEAGHALPLSAASLCVQAAQAFLAGKGGRSHG